jgi:molybdenum cofactor guanylyltransferase
MNGLILAGGESSRMGQPKALLNYWGRTQLERLHQLAQPYCSRIFVSCQAEQAAMFQAVGYHGPLIFDQRKYGNIGPMNGLLSAFEQEVTDWLVLGCDYPFISQVEIEALVSCAQGSAPAVVYRDIGSPYCEPFLGIYKPQMHPIVLESWQKGNFSLQNILRALPAQYLDPFDHIRLTNVNSPAELQEIIPIVETWLFNPTNWFR